MSRGTIYFNNTGRETCLLTSELALRDQLGETHDLEAVRALFLRPAVTDDYGIQFGEPDVQGLVTFLCDEGEFSCERVAAVLERAFPQRSLF